MNTDDMSVETEMAEAELRRLGLGGVRVCAHGELARLEVRGPDLAAVVCDPLRAEVVRAVRGAGFDRVAVDLDVL